MNGGTLIALGSSGMAMAPSSNSKQNSVMLNVDASLAAGKAIYLEDADGKFVIGAVPTRTIQSIVISSSDIKKNAVYQIMTNGTANKKRDIMATNATNGDKLTSLWKQWYDGKAQWWYASKGRKTIKKQIIKKEKEKADKQLHYENRFNL